MKTTRFRFTDGPSISSDLYTTKHRFLYELIQNADHAEYQEVLTHPYLKFDITPEKIVVDTNEIGFTRADVEAICATGRSSKKGSASDDQIGEKGLGFKSVFAVANDVHIQSGIWSFRFQHNQKEDGIGMVTPLEALPATLPADVTTRIILHLTSSSEDTYQLLLRAVSNMAETTILFLRQLKQIEFCTSDDIWEVTRTIFKKQKLLHPANCVKVTRSSVCGKQARPEFSLFHYFQKTIDTMPEDARRQTRSALVELAFPVNPTTGLPELALRG